ncbi:hypothetical protein CYLTODRAFT_346672 [Cylindrobasidium torrendii FP15055 ss-10]|uniref:DASH complex subunit DAD3 n=1 Tax=Cylindrobasidium torrendii FP15055 ss-10 TaxID=1314674 RepID=A0A0D7BN69_9AGAR|nr:hypothetical protein CYLTODRAFT_346672 [Cylindrobasidium torrendii FP15055 ss-10]
MSTAASVHSIFVTNPYEKHPQLSETEAEILWEYAKLAQTVKEITAKTKRLTSQNDETTRERLRWLEQRMGVVLTLFKASIWGVISDQQS